VIQLDVFSSLGFCHYTCVPVQDGVAVEHESVDVAGNSSTVHHNNAVYESSSPANHNQSSDQHQCVVVFFC